MPSETQTFTSRGDGERNGAGTLRPHHAQLLKQALLFSGSKMWELGQLQKRFLSPGLPLQPHVQKPALGQLGLHSGAAHCQAVSSPQLSFWCSFPVQNIGWKRHRNFWWCSPRRGLCKLDLDGVLKKQNKRHLLEWWQMCTAVPQLGFGPQPHSCSV